MKYYLPLALVFLLVACGGDDVMKPEDIAEDTDIDGSFFSSDFTAEGPKIFVRRTDGVVEYYLWAEQEDGQMFYQAAADIVVTGSAGISEGQIAGDPRRVANVDDARESCNNTGCETRGTISVQMTEEQFLKGVEEGQRVTFHGNKLVSFYIQPEYFQGFAMAVEEER